MDCLTCDHYFVCPSCGDACCVACDVSIEEVEEDCSLYRQGGLSRENILLLQKKG